MKIHAFIAFLLVSPTVAFGETIWGGGPAEGPLVISVPRNPNVLYGRVNDQDGNPVAGVNVEVYSDNELVASGISRSDGRYEFTGMQPGVYRVRMSNGSTIDSIITARVNSSADNNEKFSDALTPLRDAAPKSRNSSFVRQPGDLGVIAHKVILAHLKTIQKESKMSSSIALETYWQNVFVLAGYPDAFDAGREEIKQALDAGLSAYFEGEDITAEQFASAAIKAIQPNDGPVVATSDEIVTFH